MTCDHDNIEPQIGTDYGRMAKVWADKCIDCNYVWSVGKGGVRRPLGQMDPATGIGSDVDPETGAFRGAQRDLEFGRTLEQRGPHAHMTAALRWYAERRRQGHQCWLPPETVDAVVAELARTRGQDREAA